MSLLFMWLQTWEFWATRYDTVIGMVILQLDVGIVGIWLCARHLRSIAKAEWVRIEIHKREQRERDAR